MKVYAPDYYKNFKCIADRCQHNCCIGWEIDIDDSTLGYYKELKDNFGQSILKNVSFDETPHFKLTADERCPFLNAKGLCEIISNLGEDALCQICRDHPRFINYYDSKTEIGLGICCEAACDIIVNYSGAFLLEAISENDDAKFENAYENEVFKIREKIFETIDYDDSLISNAEKILKEQGVKFDNLNANYWFDVLSELERLDETWADILDRIKDFGLVFEGVCNGAESKLNKVLAYLIYRHFVNISLEYSVKDAVKFCVICCYIIGSMAININDIPKIARMFSCEIEYSDENIDKIINAL